MTVDLNNPTPGITLLCKDCHKEMGSFILPGASIPDTQEIINLFNKLSLFALCVDCVEKKQIETLK